MCVTATKWNSATAAVVGTGQVIIPALPKAPFSFQAFCCHRSFLSNETSCLECVLIQNSSYNHQRLKLNIISSGTLSANFPTRLMGSGADNRDHAPGVQVRV